MHEKHKPLAWMASVPKSPPLSHSARIESGYLLRLLQSGQSLSLPHSRPMPSIGKRCHELRVVDEDVTWRFFYRIDVDCIVLIHWEQKKTRRTLKATIDLCRARLAAYDD